MKKWLMQKLLSPGAYALWHSMGNPDEWKWYENDEFFWHIGSSTKIPFERWWRIAPPALYIVPPFLLFIPPLLWAFWPCSFDCNGAIGLFERHLVAGRAIRLYSKLRRREKTMAQRQKNQDLFTKLTINQTAEVKQ